MTQTLALSIGLPIGYILVGVLAARCIFTYCYNKHQPKSARETNTALTLLFWPVGIFGFGIYYFITNGVRKQNKTSGRAS